MICPIDSGDKCLRAEAGTDIQRKHDILHTVSREIDRSRIDHRAVQSHFNRDIRVRQIFVPIVHSELDRDLAVLLDLVRCHREIADRKVVVSLLPNCVKRYILLGGIGCTGSVSNRLCRTVRRPTEEHMIRSCGDCNRQDKILPVCLFLRIWSIRTAICVERHGIGVDRPNRIKRHALIGGIAASRLIVCRCCRTARCPALESVTVPCGNRGCQNQCDILGLGLTCRSVPATVGIVLYLIGLGDITPDGIECHTFFVRVSFTRCIFRCRRIS